MNWPLVVLTGTSARPAVEHHCACRGSRRSGW